MQQTSVTQKMRTIAGVIYGLLFLFNVCSLYYVLIGASITSVPVAALFEMGLTVLAGAACVFLIGGRSELPSWLVRGGVVFTALAVIFELVTFKGQLDFIGYSLWTVFPSTAPADGGTTASALQYVLFAVRLVLMILAAFFVTSAKTGTAYAEDLPEGEAGVAVVAEEVVVVSEDNAEDADKEKAEIVAEAAKEEAGEEEKKD